MAYASSVRATTSSKGKSAVPIDKPHTLLTQGLYILDEAGDPVPCNDLIAWADWMEREFQAPKSRYVGYDVVGGLEVSTIFLGINHNFAGEGHPILFETIVLSNNLRQKVSGSLPDRYTTRADALAGHAAIVAWAREHEGLSS